MARLPLAGRSGTSSKPPYCPEQFDVIHIQFDPQAGREQAGKRYAFVLSPAKYNALARLCVLCPITTKAKGYPFEVPVPDGHKTSGVVLADQIKSLDWSMREAEFFESRPDMAPHVIGMLKALLPI
ncbi:MAG: type II toxin-antitoxin system PemK/MazF family toxin [Rhizobiaceae bacterium]|nr:type II toxin-antitoxin system PemK/MazF family toxin [Rhizobiaceae bacterium]MCV0408125.1 type II toxin-antitoxin system PemK/MazF family toxin [Rhizobiaceae bacterium]